MGISLSCAAPARAVEAAAPAFAVGARRRGGVAQIPRALDQRPAQQDLAVRYRDRRQARERRADVADLRLGRTREIQRRFNVSVPRARVPEKASALRDRSER